MTAELVVFRARPSTGVGSTVHILGERLSLALSAPCGLLLAEILTERIGRS